MENSVIGTNAGIIWQLIDKNGTMDIQEIKKSTKLKEGDIFLALGWLAREGKAHFEKADGKTKITLIY